jgi:prepilin-type N-terminal cleavage/methylation domain-containing protein
MKNNSGMTLIEILIATLVFSLALGALLGSISAVVDVIDLSRDRTQVTLDLRNMLEKMRATPFDALTTKFPNNLLNGPASNPYSAIVGNYSLRSESIAVTYPNPNADPLEMQVTVNWLDKKGHARNGSISTFRTR